MEESTPQELDNVFDAVLQDTLKHYHDPTWLGNHSTLATPYFLGRYLQKATAPESTRGRGEALQQLLARAAAVLWPGELPQSRQGLLQTVEQERQTIDNGGPRYLYLLLELRYFRRYFAPHTPPNKVAAMPDFLHVSETRFFAHLQTARQELARTLLQLVRPSLRLEQPILNSSLIGRDKTIAGCLADLRAQRSVALSGMGGVGKTSLGTAVSQAWPSPAIFWHTFRPGLNDDLGSVLFALGHFLYQWGHTGLWLQLLVNEGKLADIPQALGFLRDDLEQAAVLPPLLVFDEIDLLHTETSQPRHGPHKQLLELIEGLRSLTPLLLIGQRALIDTDTHYALQPLTGSDTEQLLRRAGLTLSSATLANVHRLTEGNPRFLELYVALGKGSEQEETIRLWEAPSVKPLFNCLWKRLQETEKRVLATLAVFRSFAPADVWEGESGLNNLDQRGLIKADAQGGIALLPLFRDLVYDSLPAGQRQNSHLQAATVRARRGQFTHAAHHLWQAGEAEQAVALWFPRQALEIEQGNAGAAYAIFCGDDTVNLNGQAAKQLKLIQNRLHLLNGDAAGVLAGMDSYSWQPDEKLTADALEQWGEAFRIRGQMDKGLGKFGDAIQVLTGLSTKVVQLHRLRGEMYIQLAATQAAEREITLAQYEVEYLKGLVELARGRYAHAQPFLETAVQLAEAAADELRSASANYLLAIAVGNYGNLDLAHQHAHLAMNYYERVGDRLQLEHVRAELAGFYLNSGRFADVIEPAERALRFFENIKHEPRISYISSNLAEAYYETGQLDHAEQYALRATGSETPRVQPYAYYTLGLVHHAKGNLPASEQSFLRGIEFARLIEDRFIAAYLYRAYGRILLQEGHPTEGIAQLNRAIAIFTELTMPHEVDKTVVLLPVGNQ